MPGVRRGTVIMLQSGDPEISGAIAGGMMAGRGTGTTSSEPPMAAHLPLKGKALEPEVIEVVEAEIDRQEINMHLLRVSVGNHKTAEDYADLVTKARGDYARYSRPAGPVRRLGRRLLAIYGLLCYGVAMAYRSQERVLGNSLSRFAAAPSGREP